MTIYKRYILSIILPSLFLLTACSENQPLQARYNAEKMFHEANNALNDAKAFNPKLSAKQQTDITKLFESLVAYCYEQLEIIDSATSPVQFNEFNYMTYKAVNSLSQLYYLSNDFKNCVIVTNKVLREVHIPYEQKAAVYINLGQALQSGGNWDSSYTVYNNALDIFSPPLSDKKEIISTIFNLPLYIFRVINYIKDPITISQEFANTENYYLKLIQEYPGQKLETAARSNLAKLYEDTKQWNKELAQLALLTDPQSKAYFTILLKTADVFAAKLHKTDTAMALYDYMYDRTTDNDKDMRAILLFKKSLIQIDLKHYEDARTILHQIKQEYPKIYNQSPLFQYNFARSFELQNKWNRAEQEFNLLLDRFKGSSESMMTLLYLVDNFRKQNKQTEKEYWFTKAENYFAEVTKLGRGTLLEARTMLYQADLYNRNDEFEKSAQILTDIFKNFPRTDPGKQALIKSIRLYQNKLGDQNKADSLLEQLKLTLAKIPVMSNSQDLLEN